MASVVNRGRAAFAGAALVATLAAHASAQDEVVRIDYRAPNDCPGEAQFLEAVSRRAARSRLARTGEIARTFIVTVSMKDGGSLARLEIKDSERPIREVHAKSCTEAVHAIALVTALAMDARAGRGDDAGTASPTPAARLATTSSSAPEPSTPPSAPVLDRGPAPASQSGADAAAPRWEVGGLFVWHSPVAPTGARGGGLFAGSVAAGDGFSLRGMVFYVESGALDVDPGGASLSLMAARLDGCPLALGAEGPVTLRPCLALEGGRLRGEGRKGGAIIETTAINSIWLATGVLARIGGIFGDLFLLEAEGGPWFPLVRRVFDFEDPDIEIHRIPPVGFTLGAGAGFIFR